VAFDRVGNVYIAESAHNRIRKVDHQNDIISTVAGNGSGSYGGDGLAATAASLHSPWSVTVDQASGDMYIADYGNNVIRMVNASTQITTVAGNGSGVYAGDGQAATSAALNFPYAIAFDIIGNMYIADYGNNAVRMVNASTQIITTVAGNGTSLFPAMGRQRPALR
jgi:sugar lactone lactonase YvrE